MKILLDECVPLPFCKSFPNHECHAARPAEFGGKKNVELLRLAENAGFDVPITVDRNIPYQQNLRGRTLAVLILSVPSNRLRDLLVHESACISALSSIQPGDIVRVPRERLTR